MRNESTSPSALPTMLSVVEAAEVLGIGRTLAYKLVRTNKWPSPVIHAGRLIRIPSAPLMALVLTGSIDEGPHAA